MDDLRPLSGSPCPDLSKDLSFAASEFCLKHFSFHFASGDLGLKESHWLEGVSEPGGSVVKNLPANAGGVSSIPESGRSLEEEMTTHSSILDWRIPWIEEPVRLQSMGSQSVGQVLVSLTHPQTRQTSLTIQRIPSY